LVWELSVPGYALLTKWQGTKNNCHNCSFPQENYRKTAMTILIVIWKLMAGGWYIRNG